MGAYTSEAYTNMLSADQASGTDTTGTTAGFTTNTNATLGSSTAAAKSGARSLAVIPSNASVDSWGAVGGDTGAMRLGMVANTQYTFTGSVYIPTNAAITNAPYFRFFHNAGAGYSELQSNQADLTKRDQWQRLSVTKLLPAGTTEAFIRLQNANQPVAAVMYWDELMLELGSFTGKDIHPWVAGGATGVHQAFMSLGGGYGS